MTPQETEIAARLQPSSIGTIRFTPETLRKVLDDDIQAKIVISELYGDEVVVEERKSKASQFISSNFQSRFDRSQGIYQLTEKDVARLIILFGVDAVDDLFNSRFFEFKQVVH